MAKNYQLTVCSAAEAAACHFFGGTMIADI
jgi:hypothetical protein